MDILYMLHGLLERQTTAMLMNASNNESINGTSSEGRNASDGDLKDTIEYAVSIWLMRILLIAIVLLGTIGNGLSLCVLMRRRMRTNSVNFYLVLLALSDTCVLYASAFKTWIRTIIGFELLHVSVASCKIITFLFSFAFHASAWLIVILSIDRFIVVWFPFKAASFCSVKRARVIGTVTLLVMAVYNSHLLWTIHLYDVNPGYPQCAFLRTNHFMNGPYNYIPLVTYTLIPFILVTGANIAIIVCICNHNRTAARGLTNVQGNCSYRAEERIRQNKQQVAVMLLVVSFAWIALTMPFTVIALVAFEYPDRKTAAAVFLLKTVAFLLMYLNHSINFLLYCIAGKKFRREFVNMFRDFSASFKWKGIHSWSLYDRTRSRRTPVTPAEYIDIPHIPEEYL